MSQKSSPATLSTEALFGQRALARLGNWLGDNFKMAGLMSLPATTNWKEIALDEKTAQALTELQQTLYPEMISTAPADRYLAETEPKFMRVLRRYHGTAPECLAVVFPSSGHELSGMIAQAEALGLSFLRRGDKATGQKGQFAALPHRMTSLNDHQAKQGLITMGAGVSWDQLGAVAAKHELGVPSKLSDRFPTPMAAAEAGLFAHTTIDRVQSYPVSATFHLSPKRFAWLDPIWLFHSQDAAAKAMAQLLAETPALYVETISNIELQSGSALGFWHLNTPLRGKGPHYGLRAIYQGGLLTARAHLAEASSIVRRHGGRSWRAGAMLGETRQMEAWLLAGAGHVTHTETVDDFAPNEGVLATLADAAVYRSQFPGAQPLAATTFAKTAFGPLKRRSSLWYPRDVALPLEEAHEIYNIMASPAAPSQYPTDQEPARQERPDPEATSQSEEWQAIRDALMAQVHERPASQEAARPQKDDSPSRMKRL